MAGCAMSPEQCCRKVARLVERGWGCIAQISFVPTHLPVRRVARVTIYPSDDVQRVVPKHCTPVQLVHLLLDTVTANAVHPMHVIFVVARLVICCQRRDQGGRDVFVSRSSLVKKRSIFGVNHRTSRPCLVAAFGYQTHSTRTTRRGKDCSPPRSRGRWPRRPSFRRPRGSRCRVNTARRAQSSTDRGRTPRRARSTVRPPARPETRRLPPSRPSGGEIVPAWVPLMRLFVGWGNSELRRPRRSAPGPVRRWLSRQPGACFGSQILPRWT